MKPWATKKKKILSWFFFSNPIAALFQSFRKLHAAFYEHNFRFYHLRVQWSPACLVLHSYIFRWYLSLLRSHLRSQICLHIHIMYIFEFRCFWQQTQRLESLIIKYRFLNAFVVIALASNHFTIIGILKWLLLLELLLLTFAIYSQYTYICEVLEKIKYTGDP